MGCGYLDHLDMSRKRDHKIIITDEAIEKVPFIEYRGIPEEEYEIIHRLAKQVLQISKTENESNEVAITYRNAQLYLCIIIHLCLSFQQLIFGFSWNIEVFACLLLLQI